MDKAACAPRPDKLAPREEPHAPPHAIAELTDLGRAVLDVLRERGE